MKSIQILNKKEQKRSIMLNLYRFQIELSNNVTSLLDTTIFSQV